MVTLTAPLSLAPPTNSYRDYFAHAKTYTFRGCYAAVLAPYSINSDAAAATPANVAQLLYTVSQEGVPTVFLTCHQGASGGGGGRLLSSTQCPTTS